MEIIKNGDLNRLKKIHQFECKECGCVFKSAKDEYEVAYQYNEAILRCKCPTCGEICYRGCQE